MLDWLSDRIVALLAFFPPLFVRDEEHFMLMRGMFALLFIVLVVGVFAAFYGNQANRTETINGPALLLIVAVTSEEGAAFYLAVQGGDLFPEHGNLLFMGMDGNGAKDISDAFAYWKSQGGKFITAGLSGKFDPEKYAAFAKVVSEYRQNLKEE